MITFEGYERRIDKLNAEMKQYGIENLEEAQKICEEKGIDVRSIVLGIQPIAFENAVWAYTLGAAIAIKKGSASASQAAENIGLGLQAFCIKGSVADQRKVGIGHGNLAAMLLREDIMSETLSYIEMSVALMRRIKEEGTQNITNLQSVTDWALAFWGSAQQRVLNMKALALLLIGRCIEDIDMMVRFGYPYYRIEKYYQIVTQYLNDNPDFFDEHIKRNLDAMLTEKQYDPEDAVYKDTLLKYINQLIFV